jgi:hypothetical protein
VLGAVAALAAPRSVTGQLDGDPSIERATARAVTVSSFIQHRVVISDPDTTRVGRLGPRVDRVGRLLTADFAGLGSEQVFMDGSSGASGRFYAAAMGRGDGSRLHVLWRSVYRYSPSAGRYVLVSRTLGPKRPPTS